MQLDTFEESETIFTYGELGDKFHIIFKGFVKVLAPSSQSVPIKDLQKTSKKGKRNKDLNNYEKML